MALRCSPISTPPAPGQAAGQERDHRGGARGVDAHQLRRVRAVRHGADGEPELGAAQQPDQRGDHHRHRAQYQQLGLRDPHRAELQGVPADHVRRQAADIRAQARPSARNTAPAPLPSVTIREASSGARALRSRVSSSQSITTAISPVATAASGSAVQMPNPSARTSHSAIKAPGGEIETVGQVDHLQHAEHQREAKGEQGIRRAQQDAIDELLGEHRLLKRLPPSPRPSPDRGEGVQTRREVRVITVRW